MNNDLLFLYARNLEGNQLSGTIPTQLIVLSQNGLLESKYVLFQNSVLDNTLPLCFDFIPNELLIYLIFCNNMWNGILCWFTIW